ncbi:MAG: hypothetical protein LBN95_12395 [Prevotellaceae bacterium]|jgi:hypothetical protein|nr:hypothetical protein [Prevotellaceae bacterium]
MKNLVLLIIICLCFTACNQPPSGQYTNLPAGWDTVPEQLIKSYFPADSGENITYVSENGKSITFNVYDKRYNYSPCIVFEATGGENNETQEFRFPESIEVSIRSDTKESSSTTLHMGLHIINRTTLVVGGGCDYQKDGNNKYAICRYDVQLETKPNSDMPKEPNKIFEYLTDSLYLTNFLKPELGVNFLMVRNVGVVWFIDDEGVKWTLQE